MFARGTLDRRARSERDRRERERRYGYSESSESSEKGGIIPTMLKVSFYLSIISLVGFILLVAMQFMGFPVFSFIPGNIGAIQVTVPTNRQVQFKTTAVSVDASANFVNLLPFKYTISFDTVIASDFITQSVPRILLYRSHESIQFMSSDTLDTIDNKLVYSNLLVYLDPMKNDLYVRVYTGPIIGSPTTTDISGTPGTPGTTGRPGTVVLGPAGSSCVANSSEGFQLSSRQSITSTAIQNVPLKTPFRITLMLTDVLLEIYLNGSLQQSVPLQYPPTTIDTSSQFYGPPALSRQSALVSNISYWNTVLTSRAIRVYASEPFISIGST